VDTACSAEALTRGVPARTIASRVFSPRCDATPPGVPT